MHWKLYTYKHQQIILLASPMPSFSMVTRVRRGGVGDLGASPFIHRTRWFHKAGEGSRGFPGTCDKIRFQGIMGCKTGFDGREEQGDGSESLRWRGRGGERRDMARSGRRGHSALASFPSHQLYEFPT